MRMVATKKITQAFNVSEVLLIISHINAHIIFKTMSQKPLFHFGLFSGTGKQPGFVRVLEMEVSTPEIS